MEAELRCPVCSEYFVDPVMLHCTHHVCVSHIASLAPQGHLSCPVCGDPTTLPTEGCLRVDRALQVVVEVGREKQQVPQQNGDSSPSRTAPMCGFCEEKPATRRCIQCDGVLCVECERTSHSKGFFKSHNIVALGEKGALDGSEFRERMVCDEHAKEKLSFYCLDCRKPVCSHCLILGEHQGHHQTPIDSAWKTGKETLGAWVEKLRQRSEAAEELLEHLRAAELEVQRGAEAQRNVINSELDHLRELIETKRQQLLAKSAIEEKQKRVQLQAQIDRADAVRRDSHNHIGRSKELFALASEHAFLTLLLPVIQDMKKSAGQPLDAAPQVSNGFRPLSTDAQVRSLGDLDLGHPRPPQHHIAAAKAPPPGAVTLVGTARPEVSGVAPHVGPGLGLMPQVPPGSDASTAQPNFSVLPPGYGAAHATVSYLPAQQQVFVYRAQ